MSIRKDFQVFLYKNRLNERSLLDLVDTLSTRSIECIMKDFERLSEKSSDDDTLYIFTDGGCSKNGRPDCKAGYSVVFTTDEDSDLYDFNTTRLVVKDPTNNKAELSAVRYVFKTISENVESFTGKNIKICTDSMYSINCIDKWSDGWIKKGWKNAKGEDVKNQDIIKAIIEFKNRISQSGSSIKISFQHVFSHTQPPDDKNSLQYYLWDGNRIVDENIQKILNLN